VIRSVCGVLLTVETDEEISGECYLFTLGSEKTLVIKAMIPSLSGLSIGSDSKNTEKNWDALWADINFFGHKGISVFGVSALDNRFSRWFVIPKSFAVISSGPRTHSLSTSQLKLSREPH